MSLRRFVYLVTDDVSRRNFLLHRIDMSRFFFPKGKRDELDPPLLEEAELPPVALRFDPPTSDVGNHHMQFMLFPGGDNGRNDKVVATDLTGRVILYDPESHSVRSAPSFSVPKFAPISLAVGGGPISLAGGGGNSYYILDRDFTLNSHDRDACFHRFFHDDDWYCQYLPPPPYARAYRNDSMSHVESYAVVGGSNILVSNDTLGTHCYDTARHLWTKAGDWVLPFRGHVQYVPDHKLWFGFPSADSGKEDEGSIYASDLTVTPPTSCKVWSDDLTPAECYSKSSYLVHLGHSKFCHARFFCVKLPFDLDYQSYAVFTGMEAEVCSNSGGELRVVKHRSEQYRLVDKIVHWLL